MLNLISLPSFNDISTGISDYSNGFFTEFNWVIWIVIGLFIGGSLLLFLYDLIIGAIEYIKNYSINKSRNQTLDYIRQNKQLERNFELYQKAQSYR